MNNYLKKEWLFLIILLIPMTAAVIVYPQMPDQVPIHWNVNGQVDDYGSRAFGTFSLPILNIIMYVLFYILPKFDPKRANYSKFMSSYLIIRYAFHLFFALLFALTVCASLGYAVDIGKWVAAGVSLLFIVMGNTMGRVRHNYFVGFRLPWTLANEEVWRKTHQVGAKAMVIGGLGALVGVVFTTGTISFVILMIGILLPMFLVSIYSYVLYKKVVK